MDQLLEFAGNHLLLVLSAVMLTGMVIAYEVRLRTRGFSEVSPTDAVLLINADATVIDVREPDQYATGHIVGARNIPLATLSEDSLKKLQGKGENTLITCCATGVTGTRAAAELRRLGLTDVVNLKGGLDAWQSENLPLQKRGRK